MNMRAWLMRALLGAFLIGSAAAVALWIAAVTARCEGFGCLGVGAMVGVAFIIHVVCASIGGILIWQQRVDGRITKWVLILETLHCLPILWFVGRMGFN